MLAKELKPGDLFRTPGYVEKEGVRVCLTNDPEHGLRYKYLNQPAWWHYCGEHAQVERIVSALDLARYTVEFWESIGARAKEFQDQFGVDDATRDRMAADMRDACGGKEAYDAAKALLKEG